MGDPRIAAAELGASKMLKVSAWHNDSAPMVRWRCSVAIETFSAGSYFRHASGVLLPLRPTRSPLEVLTFTPWPNPWIRPFFLQLRSIRIPPNPAAVPATCSSSRATAVGSAKRCRASCRNRNGPCDFCQRLHLIGDAEGRWPSRRIGRQRNVHQTHAVLEMLQARRADLSSATVKDSASARDRDDDFDRPERPDIVVPPR